MSTICADELLHGPSEPREDRAHHRAPACRLPVTTRRANPGRSGMTAARGRFEDFEARSSDLGDLLGGRIFPRVF